MAEGREKMAGGYMGKILFVNLSTQEIKEEKPEESLYRDFVGGYGIGARVLYSRQRKGVDPLGPENTLGFMTGPLTGTPAVMGCRYTVLAKSPLTGGWGDSNCGGYFGPYLKFAGYDGVFFSGIAQKPVYLLIDNGSPELKDAGFLWGKSNYETEDILKARLGEEAEVASIGPSGEKLALISCIVTRKGAAAGRSGLGAVMGSKKLKAVAVRGSQVVPLADGEGANKLRKEHVAELMAAKMGPASFFESFRKYGTGGHANTAAHSGDTPVKNWGGIGIIDLPDVSGLSGDSVIANLDKHVTCWRCPIACEASLKEGIGDYKYPAGTRRPEYETLASFGAMCLNNSADAVAMANHICNSYGLDTMSTGCTIAFAMECYENGLITRADTDGIDLTWGDHHAMIAMLEKIARREGFGDVLADGTKVAAKKIGQGAEQYAMNIGGQEIGYHDPKLASPFDKGTAAARYWLDATPGRHSQGFGPSSFGGHFRNAAGVCLTGYGVVDSAKYFELYMNAVTGWQRPWKELLKAGERIANIRHVFNLREGINPLNWSVPPRMIGDPPQKAGPLAGVNVDIKAQSYWNLGALDWEEKTTRPSKAKLLDLGLDDIARELWPPKV
jgi:aldehyde:ferredoxin oxidoreductase